jgi:archaellum biogenesis ATPase FlaH
LIKNDQSLAYLLIAKAQGKMGDFPSQITALEQAKDLAIIDYQPQFYLMILCNLQQAYFQQKAYLKAFKIKQDVKSLEQKYRLRAFIGAGRIQAQRKVQLLNFPNFNDQESIAQEIAFSGRQIDVDHLVERIGSNDYKLIVIHGFSGVGKSSLVDGGLIPALNNIASISDYETVALRKYTNWLQELSHLLFPFPPDLLSQEKAEREGELKEQILTELRKSSSQNLTRVLIFDQFEEFFFVNHDPLARRQFFEFMGECLNILNVKVILSLREDYLHYLLECNRLESMKSISQDILSKNVLYALGNFTPDDAIKIIQKLTQNSYFHLQDDLIAELVKDLAGTLQEVRPIELQIIGAQLQRDNITELPPCNCTIVQSKAR